APAVITRARTAARSGTSAATGPGNWRCARQRTGVPICRPARDVRRRHGPALLHLRLELVLRRRRHLLPEPDEEQRARALQDAADATVGSRSVSGRLDGVSAKRR